MSGCVIQCIHTVCCQQHMWSVMVFKSNKNSVKMDQFHVVCVSACALPLVSAHVCESLCCYYDNNPFTRACTLSFPCLGVKFSLETGTDVDVCVHACSGQSSKALKAVDSFVPLLMCSWQTLVSATVCMAFWGNRFMQVRSKCVMPFIALAASWMCCAIYTH